MAKKITEESLRLNIIINGDRARQQILGQEKSIDALHKSRQRLLDQRQKLERQGKTETKQFHDTELAIRDYDKSISEAQKRLENMRKGLPLTSMTMQELRKHINQTKAALANAVPNTSNWSRLNAELQQSKTQLKILETQSLATDKTVCSLAGRIRDYYISARGAADAVGTVWSIITKATDAYQEYDESLTDTMKTTNLTKEEVTALGKALEKMDTRTAQNGLMGLARIGGKLGITGQENLLGFVRAADKINVALSEDLGGDAEGAIAAIGKMVDIFQLEESFGLEESLLKVGSAVNSLGMASTANEGYIVDFTKRLAGIAPNADISIDKVLGLAATLDKYGQTSEMSSTAIGQTIMAMFKRTETFAGIAGMELKEFTDLLNNDVNEAFIRVLEGMKGSDGSLHSVVAAMDEMHLNGQRAAQVLGTLSKNTDELRSQQELANQAFTEGTSLLDEFAVKNESATARMEKSRNAIHNQVVEIGQQLMPVVEGAMDLAEVGMGILTKLVGLLVSLRGAIMALAVAYAIVKVAKMADIAIDKLRHFYSKQNREDLALEATMLEGSARKTIALSVAKNLLAGNFKAAGKAAKAFFTSIKTGLGPIGWIILAIEALGAAIAFMVKRSRESTKALRELNKTQIDTNQAFTDAQSKIKGERDALKELETAALNAASGSRERATAIKAINDRYGDYLPNLLTEKSSNEEITTALRGVNEQLEKKILLQAKEQELVKVQQHRSDTVKAVLESAEVLSQQNRKKGLSAAETKHIAQVASEYYDALFNGSEEYFTKALPGLSTALGNVGGSPKQVGKIRQELNEAVQNGYKLKTVIDELYKDAGTGSGLVPNPDPDPNPDLDPDGSNGGGNGGTDNPGKWSLSNDKAHQEAVLALKKEYAEGMILTEKDLNDKILQLEIDTLQKRLEIAQGDEILEVDSQLQDKLIRQKNNRIAEETRQANEEKKTEMQILLEKIKEKENLTKAAYELERTRLQNKHNQELADAKAQGENLEELKKEQAKELSAVDMKYIQDLSAILEELTEEDHRIDLDLSGADADIIALKQKIQDLIALKNKLEGKETVSYSGGSSSQSGSDNAASEPNEEHPGSSLFGVHSSDWAELIQAMKDGTMGAKEWSTAIRGVGGMAEYAMKMASQWADKQTKLEQKQLKEYEKANDKKKTALEKRLNAGLMSEAQYNAEMEAMDAEYEALQEEIALKQAKRQKQMSLIQAIINTALSVTMALASSPPPANFVMAAINAALGAAEIAMIASQPITTGYADGGMIDVKRAQDGKVFKANLSPDRGFINRPTALVGENGNEYVIPAEGLENPTLVPFLGTIETARRNGTLRNIDFGAIYSPMITAMGRAAGGFTSDEQLNLSNVSSYDSNCPSDKIVILLQKIIAKLDDPVPAIVDMLGPHGLVQQMENYKKAKKRGRL